MPNTATSASNSFLLATYFTKLLFINGSLESMKWLNVCKSGSLHFQKMAFLIWHGQLASNLSLHWQLQPSNFDSSFLNVCFENMLKRNFIIIDYVFKASPLHLFNQSLGSNSRFLLIENCILAPSHMETMTQQISCFLFIVWHMFVYRYVI